MTLSNVNLPNEPVGVDSHRRVHYGFGVDSMIEEARAGVAEFVNPAALRWLPDVREHFNLMLE